MPSLTRTRDPEGTDWVVAFSQKNNKFSTCLKKKILETRNTKILFHKNDFQKIVESCLIWSLHHVDLLWDHPEAQLVEILQNPQQIDVLSVRNRIILYYRIIIIYKYSHLSSSGRSGMWSSRAIWLTVSRAPELIQSWNPPSLNSEPSISIFINMLD